TVYSMTTNNPLLQEFSLPNNVPPFDKIKEEHYLPAVQAAIEEARASIEAIKANPEAPTFANTVAAMETSGERLGTTTTIFYNQLSAAGTDALEELAQEIGPLSSNFGSDVIMDAELFKRVKAVYDVRETLTLTNEEKTIL